MCILLHISLGLLLVLWLFFNLFIRNGNLLILLFYGKILCETSELLDLFRCEISFNNIVPFIGSLTALNGAQNHTTFFYLLFYGLYCTFMTKFVNAFRKVDQIVFFVNLEATKTFTHRQIIMICPRRFLWIASFFLKCLCFWIRLLLLKILESRWIIHKLHFGYFFALFGFIRQKLLRLHWVVIGQTQSCIVTISI